MRPLHRIWMVVFALLLVSCGAENAPDPVDTPATPEASPAAESAPEMEVGPLVWAQELDPDTGEPMDIVTRFTTESPAIIAVVEVEELPEGTEFTATWTINDQVIDGTDMDITASEDLEHSWISFSFTRDVGQRYPIGILGVVITSSEGDLREGSVEIGFP